MATTTIVNGLFIVPVSEQYIFKRSPEIMDWFATQGYGFKQRHDANESYVSIPMIRERNGDHGFSNCGTANSTMLRGGRLNPAHHFDITSMIEAHLIPTSPESYEYW